MTSRARYLFVLASLALGACAAQTPPVTSWDMPAVPMQSVPQPTRAEAKANPPHPTILYDDYTMEPTRFVFRPRPPATDQNDDNADNGNGGDNGDYAVQDVDGGMNAGF